GGAPPAGARAELDGAAAKLDELQAGAPVEPGRHVVVLIVPGGADQRATVDLAQGEAKTVSLAGAAPAPGGPGAGEGADTGGPSGVRIGGFVLLGVGGAGFVAAAATGAMLLSKHAQILKECPTRGTTNVCTPAGRALINSTGGLNVANAVA